MENWGRGCCTKQETDCRVQRSIIRDEMLVYVNINNRLFEKRQVLSSREGKPKDDASHAVGSDLSPLGVRLRDEQKIRLLRSYLSENAFLLFITLCLFVERYLMPSDMS